MKMLCFKLEFKSKLYKNLWLGTIIYKVNVDTKLNYNQMNLLIVVHEHSL